LFLGGGGGGVGRCSGDGATAHRHRAAHDNRPAARRAPPPPRTKRPRTPLKHCCNGSSSSHLRERARARFKGARRGDGEFWSGARARALAQ